METRIVQQGRAAWERLKKGRANYDDWVLVGHALIEGRKVAMRNASCSSPAGRGYSDAFGDFDTWSITAEISRLGLTGSVILASSFRRSSNGA
jgi:hypothetical protein